MRLYLEEPTWLWLLASAIVMAWAGLMLFQAMAPVRRWVSVLVRVLLVVALVALLGGLAMLRTTDRLAVVAVVDVSGSVQRFFSERDADGRQLTVREGVRKYLERTLGQRRFDDLAGIVVFDGDAATVTLPSQPPQRVWERDLPSPGVDGTNLAEAVRLASAIIPPDAAGRLLVFTDGNQTMGDALEAISQVRSVAGRERRGGLPIDVVPLRYKLGSEVIVEAVDAPPTAPAESTVNVRVVLWATEASTGTLQLLREGAAMDLNGPAAGLGRRVSLSPGRNVVQLEVDLGPGRVHRFKAVYEPDAMDAANASGSQQIFAGDTVLENNQGQAFTISPGKGSVLLVDGVSGGREAGAGRTLASALGRAGVSVTTVSPEEMPTTILQLQAFDMVIFENVSADALDPAAQEAYVAFVRDLGGGLAMVGGPNSFGAGGWKSTPIASILPVDVELPDKIVAPEVATVFVIDNSGSMRRPVLGSRQTQQQLANEATALAINSLDRSDLVGVVAFNSEADVVVRLAPNRDSKDSVERVRNIRSGGGTDIAEGLERAIDQFKDLDANPQVAKSVKVRQCILLTDGKSMREEELPGLVDQLVKMGVKVNTIAVGDDADTSTLERLARQGGGAYFYAMNPQNLPRIFLKAVRVVRSPLIREGDFGPVVLPSGSAMVAGVREPPVLGGLVLTRLRQEPTVVQSIVAPTGEPVLASWQVGLGQVVAFTSDAHSWADEWLGWPGYERMWSQIVRAASRPADGRGVQATASASGDGLALRVDIRNEDGSPAVGLDVPATIYDPAGGTREVSLAAVGPGQYEVRVPTRETGSYVALVKPSVNGRRLAPAIVGATLQEGAEFRVLASNDALIEQLAKAGGGRVLDMANPASANLFDRTGIKPAESISSLWQFMMIATLGLFLLDVATRRVAWDRYVSRRFRLPGSREQRVPTGAAAVVGGLRARLDATDERREAAPSLALSDQDAAALAAAARDRRRAARLGGLGNAGVRAETQPVGGTAAMQSPNVNAPAIEDKTQKKDEDGGGGLLAAKKRAARRFEED
jgi:Ca-activated chloride channel homolog